MKNLPMGRSAQATDRSMPTPIRFLIGCIQTFVTRGPHTARSSAERILSIVIPGRHSACGSN
jgi:hypothetical protein